MKGEVINYTHNDIYFLDTKSNSESTDLANLFASPAGREMVKFKPRVKSKHKLNPALDFFLNNNKSTKTVATASTSSSSSALVTDAVISIPPTASCSSSCSTSSFSSSSSCSSTSSNSSNNSCCINASSNNNNRVSSRVEVVSRSRRSSIDLYEEAATILGLTCSQTDDCKCIECQCHYFDFEEEIDFPTGADCVMGHASTCSIQ